MTLNPASRPAARMIPPIPAAVSSVNAPKKFVMTDVSAFPSAPIRERITSAAPRANIKPAIPAPRAAKPFANPTPSFATPLPNAPIPVPIPPNNPARIPPDFESLSLNVAKEPVRESLISLKILVFSASLCSASLSDSA